MNARVSRFQVRFDVDGEGRVSAELESINKDAKKTALEAGEAWSGFGKKLGSVMGWAGGVAVAGMALIVKNTIEAEQELAQLGAVLRSTGQDATFTRDELVSMSEGIAKASTYSTGEIIKAETRLLSYSGIASEVFPEALQVAIDQAARLGMSVEQSAETIGRALESPTKAAAALAQQGFGAAFTDSVRTSIKALEDAGKTADAQRIVIDILNESYEGAAAAARDTFGGALIALKHTLNDLATGGDGSLDGATEALNDLIDTLNDPSVREGFASIVAGVASVTAELVEGISKLANWISQVREVNGLASGRVKVEDAQYENLNARLGQAATERRALVNWTGYRSEGKEQFRLERIAALDKEITELQREITNRIKAERFSGVTATVTSTYIDRANKPEPSSDVENTKSRRMTEEERAAKRLQATYDSMLGSYNEQIALYGQVGEAAKVRYATEHGALKDLLPEKKAELLVLAEYLDQLDEEAALKRRLDDMEADRNAVFDTLAAERAELGLSNDELEIRYRLIRAGTTAQTALGQEIIATTRRLQEDRRALGMQIEVADSIRDAGKDLFKDYVSGAKSFKDAAIDALDSFRNRLLDIVAERLFEQLLGQRGSANPGQGGGWAQTFGSFISSLFGGGRASGGGTQPGKLYEVGEGGQPELFEKNGRTWLIPGAGGGNVVPASYAAAPAAAPGARGAAIVNVEVINNGAPATAQASVSQQPDGTQLIRIVLDAVASDINGGGRVGGAIRGRFDVKERV